MYSNLAEHNKSSRSGGGKNATKQEDIMTAILIMFAIFFVSFVSFFISHILGKETFSKVCLAIASVDLCALFIVIWTCAFLGL